MKQRQLAARLIFFAILALALVLRLVKLDLSFWGDETLTLRVAAQDFEHVATHSVYPINCIQTHLALMLGDDESLVRMPSVAFGLLAVVAIYYLAKTHFGRVAGLSAALLLAVSPAHIWVCQEARYYALHVLAGTILIWSAYLSLTRGKWWAWTTLTVTCAVGILNHTFFAVFVGVVALAGICWIAWTSELSGLRTKTARIAAYSCCIFVGITPFLGLGALRGWSILNLVKVGGSDVAVTGQAHAGEVAGPSPSQDNYDEALDERLYGVVPGGGVAHPRVFSRLELPQFGRILFQSCFNLTSPLAFCLQLVLVVWGLAVMWRRIPAMALICLFILFVAPLPFFLVKTGHMLSFRYFSVYLPAVFVPMSVGIDAVSRAVASWGRAHFAGLVTLDREVIRAVMVPRSRILMIGAGAAALVLLAVSTTGGFFGVVYGVMERIPGAPTPDDLPPSALLFLGPLTAMALLFLGIVAIVLGFRLFVAGGRRSIAVFLSKRPQLVRLMVIVLVFTVMAPSSAYALRKYFERPGYKGEDWDNCAKYMANVLGPDDVIVFFKEAEYLRTYSIPLEYYLTQHARNGEVVVPNIRRYFGMFANLPAVRDVAVKHPNSTIWVVNAAEFIWTGQVAELDAAADDRLHFGIIGLRYFGEPTVNMVAGGGFERGDAAVSASGSVALVGKEDAYQGKQCLRIGSLAPGFHCVTLDLLSREGAMLTDARHTLSMAIRYNTDILEHPKDIEANQGAPVGVCMLISGVDAAGKPFEKELVRLRGKHGWHHAYFVLEPGVDFPRDAQSLCMRAGVHGGTGTLWLDSVQFEAKDHPTPFIDGARPPHAERFALAP